MTILFANNATSRLTAATPAASATVTLPSGDGGQFPLPGAGDSFMVTLEDRRTGQMEICRCTARSADVLTVTRGQEGTVAQDFLVGATVSNRMTAGTLEILQEAYLKSEADAKFVDVAGDTMTGPLALPAGAPTAGPHATNKTYVDTGLATKAPTVHTHVESDVTNLVADLAAKEAKAPIDGAFYGRMATSWTIPGIPQITGLQAALDSKLGDAPADSVIYGRRNSIWTAVLFDWTSITGKPATYPPTLPIQEVDVVGLVADLASKVPEAPMTGSQYARTMGAWAVVSGGAGGGIPEAPTDGQLYGRKSSNWFVVPPSDWASIPGKPSTFPPTTPIAQSDITNLVADQAAQNTSINGKEPAIAAGTATDFWRGDKVWAPLSGITVDAYTKAQADARFAPIVHTHVIADVTGLTSALAGKEPTITGGTTAQYWRGDKSWQTLPPAGIADAPSDGNTYGRKNATWATVAASVAVGLTPPASPRNGDLWWKSDVCLLYVYYDDGSTQQWVVSSPNQDLGSLDARYKQVSEGATGCFKISSGTLASAAAQVDTVLPAGYHSYEWLWANVAPVSDVQNFCIRVSQDGGASFVTATNYSWAGNVTTATALTNTVTGGNSQTVVGLTPALSNAAPVRSALRVLMPVADPAVPLPQHWIIQASCYQSTPIGYANFSAMGASPGLVNAVRFFFPTGNIQAGAKWQLNGYK